VPNVSTVDWPREFINKRFVPAIKKLGFRNRSHFFDHVGKAYINQIESDEKLIWPLRFATEEPPKAKRKRPRRKT
jgi:hypothetical protein